MKIAIASGKGGTGKTTVAVNLAVLLADSGREVAFADCDVEEPNAHVFLTPVWETEEQAFMPIPRFVQERCLGESCRACLDLCRFKALIRMAGEIMLFPELCHGCGLCKLACPAGAVADDVRELGVVRSGVSGGIRMAGGLSRVGEAMSTPLIKAVKQNVHTAPLQIWDCPPGTACPVIAAVSGADYVVLVAEPTAFGLHDLNLAVELVRALGLPHGVVINRDGMGDDRVLSYLEREGIELLGRIPGSLEAARASARGGLLARTFPEIRAVLETVLATVQDRIRASAGQKEASCVR
ncbi:P-loop NTPase [Desulfovibrio sulfodismutans]|uniref:P-loop NTPase n=1 Tax=Desulfolutivibrio sulfodismutans TaxID=63561 RepID=A0A7K3NM73_9BACT|nr:ATP-binding protein [Desulfolutivibrio sulfodismutans]NDY57302.1 P-loop NTPase [Desulfolutivibrio sulfodismutans]QLA13955.1 P-loop NTPase [Desulfolutivibrio sulfodismutans DSM 3696]